MDFNEQCKHALITFWKKEGAEDSAHDLAHIMRVKKNALMIAAAEEKSGRSVDHDVLIPAVYFHDLVNLPKDHPDRAKASALSADQAAIYLQEWGARDEKIEAIKHAIIAHSFSAGITPETLEAQILQDADRIDALGAIGIARCFAVSGALGRPLIHAEDPLCKCRMADDTRYAVDHFFVKLLKLPETMNTASGKDLAQERADYMRAFLGQIETEQCH